MRNEEWFVSTGERNLKHFFSMIAKVKVIGESRGLNTEKVNVDELMRAYRGESISLTDIERGKAKEMFREGVSIQKIADRYGVNWNVIKGIINQMEVRDEIN